MAIRFRWFGFRAELETPSHGGDQRGLGCVRHRVQIRFRAVKVVGESGLGAVQIPGIRLPAYPLLPASLEAAKQCFWLERTLLVQSGVQVGLQGKFLHVSIHSLCQSGLRRLCFRFTSGRTAARGASLRPFPVEQFVGVLSMPLPPYPTLPLQRKLSVEVVGGRGERPGHRWRILQELAGRGDGAVVVTRPLLFHNRLFSLHDRLVGVIRFRILLLAPVTTQNLLPLFHVPQKDLCHRFPAEIYLLLPKWRNRAVYERR